jgi:ABC-type transport system substrate-binding protein
VSTHERLTSLEKPETVGASAALAELVYLPISSHFSSVRRLGNHALLERTPTSNLSPEELSGVFRHVKLTAARPTATGIDVVFSDPGELSTPLLNFPALDIGPYRQSEFTGERLVLERRGHGDGPARIEVNNVPTEEEEWRRFLAREVDLVPSASAGHVRYLDEVPSVRVVSVEQPSVASLTFHVEASIFADRRLRRAVSLAIVRSAVARVVVGDASLAAAASEDRAAARSLLAEAGVSEERPARFRLLVPEGSTDFQRAALVIQEQLAALGLEAQVVELGLEASVAALVNGDFDAVILPGSDDRDHWFRFHSGPVRWNYARYLNPAFDEAADRGDEPRARAILREDVPLTPLYLMRDAVAMDRSLCGAHPVHPFDLAWLADVHRCAPGEAQ